MGQHNLDAGAGPKVAVGEIRSLNGLRGAAALAVAAYHGPQLFGVGHHLPHAYLAVDLFFILSGFVMSHVYSGRITGGMPLARFVQLRMARLYPLLAIVTLVGFGLWLIKAGVHKIPFSWRAFPDLAANLLLLPADSHYYTDNGDAFPFASQSWSIFWEVAACLSYYLWVRFVGRGELALVILGSGLLCIVTASRGTIDGGWTYQSFWVGGVRAFSGFWIGVFLRSLLAGRIGQGTPARLMITASFGSAAMLAYVLFAPSTAWLVDYSIVVLVFPLLIAAAAMSPSPLFNNDVGDALGAASYSVYLLHGFAIDVTVHLIRRLPSVTQPLAAVRGCVWMGALVVLCWLGWRRVEVPLRRLFSQPLHKPPRQALQAKSY